MKKTILGRPPTDIPTYHLDENFYQRLLDFSKKFTTLAETELGDYLVNVDEFLKKVSHPKYPKDENAIWKQHPRANYFLDMLTYQFMSELLWENFSKAEITVVILPHCLSIKGDDCPAKKTKFGKRCKGCSTDCQGKLVLDLETEFDTEPYKMKVLSYFAERQMIPCIKALQKKYSSLSLIGVACILMLANGMRQSLEAGIPSQGVLLNYTGCKIWRADPKPTQFFISKLKEILIRKAKKSEEKTEKPAF